MAITFNNALQHAPRALRNQNLDMKLGAIATFHEAHLMDNLHSTGRSVHKNNLAENPKLCKAKAVAVCIRPSMEHYGKAYVIKGNTKKYLDLAPVGGGQPLRSLSTNFVVVQAEDYAEVTAHKGVVVEGNRQYGITVHGWFGICLDNAGKFRDYQNIDGRAGEDYALDTSLVTPVYIKDPLSMSFFRKELGLAEIRLDGTEQELDDDYKYDIARWGAGCYDREEYEIPKEQGVGKGIGIADGAGVPEAVAEELVKGFRAEWVAWPGGEMPVVKPALKPKPAPKAAPVDDPVVDPVIALRKEYDGKSVEISKGSEFFGHNTPVNPEGTGTVTAVTSEEYGIYVTWANGLKNVYRAVDLIVTAAVADN